MAKAPRTPRPVLTPAPVPAVPQVASAIVPAAAERQPASEPAIVEEADAPAAPVEGEYPTATPEIAPSDGLVWMKMKTGLGGPDFSLSPGDAHQFDAEEADRLEKAGFAEPIAALTA